MTTLELLEDLRRLREILGDAKVNALLFVLEESYPQLIDDALKIDSRQPQASIPERLANVDQFVAERRGRIRETQIGSVFLSLDRWIEQLRTVNNRLNPDKFSESGLNRLLEQAEFLFQSYERFVSSYDTASTRYLVLAGHEVWSSK